MQVYVGTPEYRHTAHGTEYNYDYQLIDVVKQFFSKREHNKELQTSLICKVFRFVRQPDGMLLDLDGNPPPKGLSDLPMACVLSDTRRAALPPGEDSVKFAMHLFRDIGACPSLSHLSPAYDDHYFAEYVPGRWAQEFGIRLAPSAPPMSGFTAHAGDVPTPQPNELQSFLGSLSADQLRMLLAQKQGGAGGGGNGIGHGGGESWPAQPSFGTAPARGPGSYLHTKLCEAGGTPSEGNVVGARIGSVKLESVSGVRRKLEELVSR